MSDDELPPCKVAAGISVYYAESSVVMVPIHFGSYTVKAHSSWVLWRQKQGQRQE